MAHLSLSPESSLTNQMNSYLLGDRSTIDRFHVDSDKGYAEMVMASAQLAQVILSRLTEKMQYDSDRVRSIEAIINSW